MEELERQSGGDMEGTWREYEGNNNIISNFLFKIPK